MCFISIINSHDSFPGDVITSHPIDYEQFIEYTLIIKASDHGIPLRSTTTELQISVIDQNDNFPAMKTFKTSIAEDALLGTRVGVVSATDRDTGLNGQVSFETGSPGFPFNVSDKGKRINDRYLFSTNTVWGRSILKEKKAVGDA